MKMTLSWVSHSVCSQIVRCIWHATVPPQTVIMLFYQRHCCRIEWHKFQCLITFFIQTLLQYQVIYAMVRTISFWSNTSCLVNFSIFLGTSSFNNLKILPFIEKYNALTKFWLNINVKVHLYNGDDHWKKIVGSSNHSLKNLLF